MDECRTLSELLPDLLTDTVPAEKREGAFAHAESCDVCRDDWKAYRLIWEGLGTLEDREVPAAVAGGFNAELDRLRQEEKKIVSFPALRRPLVWAQAAALILMVSVAYLIGRDGSGSPTIPATPATIDQVQMIGDDGTTFLPVSRVSEVLDQGSNIRNVRLESGEAGMKVSFDLSSEVVVEGNMQDPGFSRLLSHVIQRTESPTYERSRMIDLVRDAYSSTEADPEIALALARVLTSDAHEGVRLKAVDALRTVRADDVPEVRAALVSVLRNDPNPAIRMKAIDALGNLVSSRTEMDAAMLDTLREKAAQDDENMYVRVKAADALRQMNL